MAYPDHYLLQYGGDLMGSEEWSNNIRLVPSLGQVVEESQYEAAFDDIAADLAGFYNNTSFITTMRITYIKLNRIGPDGKYVDQTNSKVRFLTTPITGAATTPLPPQVALALTFTTDATRGLASRGRIFLAGLSSAWAPVIAADGMITAAKATDMATAAGAFLNTLNNWPGMDVSWAGLDASVVSPGNLTQPGVARKITGVKVGRVYDTQRRRRKALEEGYSAAVAVS